MSRALLDRLAAAGVRTTSAQEGEEAVSEKVTLRVAGTRHFTSYIRFRRELIGMPGVREVQVTERTAETAVLIVDFQGAVEEFAGILQLKDFETFRLDVTAVEETGIAVDLVPLEDNAPEAAGSVAEPEGSTLTPQ
jgi:hypothetical protein